MSDRSFGDYTNRNIVKNPLLSTAVTGLSIEDLTQNAVLLPAVPSQELNTRQGKKTMNNVRKRLDYREDEIIDNVEKYFEIEKNDASDLLRNLKYAKLQSTPEGPVQITQQLFNRLKNYVYGLTKINERVMLATGVGKSSVSMARRETGTSKPKNVSGKNVATTEDLSEEVCEDNAAANATDGPNVLQTKGSTKNVVATTKRSSLQSQDNVKVHVSNYQIVKTLQGKGAGKNLVVITKNVSNQHRQNDEATGKHRQVGSKKRQVVYITKNLKRVRQNDDEINRKQGQGSSKQVVIITKNKTPKRVRQDFVEEVVVDEQNIAIEDETHDEVAGKSLVVITKNVSNRHRQNDEATGKHRQVGSKKRQVVYTTKNLKRVRQNDDEINRKQGQGSSKQVVIITKNKTPKRVRQDFVEEEAVDEQNIAIEDETHDEVAGSSESGQEMRDEVYAIETEINDDEVHNYILGGYVGDVQNYDEGTERVEENAIINAKGPHDRSNE